MEDRLMYRCPFFDNENKFIGFGFYNVLKGLEPYNAGRCHRGRVELSTGIRDKNNKIVYEGDIVREKNITGRDEEYVSEVKRVLGGFDLTPDEDFSIEVLGNIYENKELLEEE